MALEIRPQRFAFALLETPLPPKLVEWGIRANGVAGRDTDRYARLHSLLKYFAPNVIAIAGPSKAAAVLNSDLQSVIEGVQTTLPCSVVMLKRNDVRRVLAARDAHTRYASALLICEYFPELQRKLPAKRKPWQSERKNLIIFDAMATALTLLFRDPDSALFPNTIT